MTPKQAEEYTQSLGQIVAGSWRQIALAKQLGVPKALGLTTERWVNERLGGYVRQSIPERREAVKELSAQGLSQRAIGEVLGVDEGTVRGDVRAENSAPSSKKTNNINEPSSVATENSAAPIDAFATLAADDAVRDQIAAEQAKAEKQAERLAARAESLDGDGCSVNDLTKLIVAGRKYAVIYADPPWSFKVYSGKGKSRSAERHYDTASLDDIKALPVGNLAGSDCALFLWAVMPQLPEALEVIHAWGFEYKTVAFVWVKTNEHDKYVALDGAGLHWGMGYWTRANTEVCLLATKGAPKRLDEGVHQVVISPVAEHSRKPDEVQVRIERLLAGPYLELFARRTTEHWTVWGNQIERGLFHQHIRELTMEGPRDSYNADADIRESVVEGFSVIRERVVAAGGWAEQVQQGFPDLPDFLRRGGDAQ
jgi:N6-adenosine-specific RNA methylase IME4